MTSFLVKYPITDAVLDDSLKYAERNMRLLDLGARDGYEYPADPTPRQRHDFDWALEEIQFHSHLTHLWCVRNGRVV